MRWTSDSDLPEGCRIGARSSITCDELDHVGPFTIDDDVTIDARVVRLGHGARIERFTTVRALRGRTDTFALGDWSLLSYQMQVMVPTFSCGDYTQIFNSCLLSGYQELRLGHNCWVGQGAVLNAAERLTLGNNVRMGGSQIWTHVASGELLEGSMFFGEKPVTVEDDVWMMGFGHMVTPGVTLGRGSVIMAGSVVTKSTEPYHTYSGIPARDITDKIPAWKPMTLDDKLRMLRGFVDEFVAEHEDARGRVHVLDAVDAAAIDRIAGPALVFAREVALGSLPDRADVSVFDLTTKRYTKRRTDLEVRWIRFGNGYRARWVPYQAGA